VIEQQNAQIARPLEHTSMKLDHSFQPPPAWDPVDNDYWDPLLQHVSSSEGDHRSRIECIEEASHCWRGAGDLGPQDVDTPLPTSVPATDCASHECAGLATTFGCGD
jgi:hypothetical protein